MIHNSADAAASVVDVWLDDTLLIDDFAFRTASPFVDAPAGVEFTIAIQPANSTSPENPIWSQNYTLAAGETYVLVANGLVDDQNYDPFVPFDIYVYDMGREAAEVATNTDVLVFHGSTDAPTVDVVETGVGAGTIINDFMYGDFAGYLSLPSTDYVLEVRDETGTQTVAAYSAPLSAFEGQALTVLASGFLNPADNNNGEAFGLYVASAAGGELIALPLVTNLEEVSSLEEVSLFPNPAKDQVNIAYDLDFSSKVMIEIFDLVGKKVFETNLGDQPAGSNLTNINVSDFTNGLYLVKITANNFPLTKKIMIGQ